MILDSVQFQTIYSPDDEMATKGVACAIVKLIKQSKERPTFILRYFEPGIDQMVRDCPRKECFLTSVVLSPMQLKLSSKNPRAFLDDPSVETVFRFMNALFKKAQVDTGNLSTINLCLFLVRCS